MRRPLLKTVRSRFSQMEFLVLPIALLTLLASEASAGVSEISAHGKTFTPGATIPVFVDPSAANSIMVKGQFMDLATGVSSTDSGFTPSIGRRIMGTNSAIEIKVGVALSNPDGDEATIKIHFVSGEERVKVKAFKTKITKLSLHPFRSDNKYNVGETVTLVVDGEGVDHVDTGGPAAAMLAVAAGGIYSVSGPVSTGSSSTRAAFEIKLLKAGNITVTPQWFRDSRPGSPVGEAMVRGNPSPIRITAVAPDFSNRKPVK